VIAPGGVVAPNADHWTTTFRSFAAAALSIPSVTALRMYSCGTSASSTTSTDGGHLRSNRVAVRPSSLSLPVTLEMEFFSILLNRA